MPEDDSNWGKYLGIGLQIAVGAGLGYLVGGWLDRRYGWGSTATAIGVLLGVSAGLYLLIKDAIKMNKD